MNNLTSSPCQPYFKGLRANRALHDMWFATDNWKTIDPRAPIALSSTLAAVIRDTTAQFTVAVNAEYALAA